eukprot:gene27078-biopygen17636
MSGCVHHVDVLVTHAKYPSLTETGVQDRKSDWVQADDPLRG